MGVEITAYKSEYIDNVRRFNERLVQGGEGDYQLPRDLDQFEKSAHTPLPWEGWLAVQDAVVRGGYLLRRQAFSFDNTTRTVGFYNLSVSEGSIDRAYAQIGVRMVTHAAKVSPLTFALGMGGVDKRLPRFLKALGWTLHEVPFLFRVVHGGRFVREIVALRTTPVRRVGLDLMAFSGAASVGFKGLHAFRRKTRQSNVQSEETADFGPWADSIWQSCGACFGMIGVRDSAALNALYPAASPRLSRLKVLSSDKLIGWVVVLHTKMQDHKQFGNLHVGTIVDSLSLPENAAEVTEAGDRFLENQGVDLIVTNQSHEAFRSALLEKGYLEGPSNYVLAMSKELARLLDPLKKKLTRIHITRGDGDGPIHL
jgi:hypothetical protein